MQKIIINYSDSNPTLKCKEDSYFSGQFFEKGKEYKIYRVLYFNDDKYSNKYDYLFYIINNGPDGPDVVSLLHNPFYIAFWNNSSNNRYPYIYNYFYGVDKLLEKYLRKVKLEEIENGI